MGRKDQELKAQNTTTTPSSGADLCVDGSCRPTGGWPPPAIGFSQLDVTVGWPLAGHAGQPENAIKIW
jgi:hypothetical protein